jgi:hypothetical protein
MALTRQNEVEIGPQWMSRTILILALLALTCFWHGASFGSGKILMAQSGKPDGVANLPYARGRVFHSLDDYLAHLERQGAIDLPWWRQVSPGVYERVVRGFPGRAPERATRAELMRRFGFSR